MSMKTDQAIEKITNECRGKDYLIPFEEYVTSICNTDAVAEKILQPEKSLQGAFDKMRGSASGRKKNGFAYIPPEEGFGIIRDYFEITKEDISAKPAEAADVIDITDFL